MANFNKVILLGRLTSDPEVKSTPQGTAICKFSIAVERKATINSEKVTDFFDCISWKERAEFVGKYFKKCAHILVEGELQTREWTGKDGVKRKSVEVSVISAGFVDAKPRETSQSAPAQSAPPQFGTVAPQFETVKPDDDTLPF